MPQIDIERTFFVLTRVCLSYRNVTDLPEPGTALASRLRPVAARVRVYGYAASRRDLRVSSKVYG